MPACPMCTLGTAGAALVLQLLTFLMLQLLGRLARDAYGVADDSRPTEAFLRVRDRTLEAVCWRSALA